MAKKETHGNVASEASAVLRDKNATPQQKSAAGSALSQHSTHKGSHKEAASKASAILRDKNATAEQKSVAGSVLAQKED